MITLRKICLDNKHMLRPYGRLDQRIDDACAAQTVVRVEMGTARRAATKFVCRGNEVTIAIEKAA